MSTTTSRSSATNMFSARSSSPAPKGCAAPTRNRAKRPRFALFLVGAAHPFGAGDDDLAENIFVADDLEVVVDIRRRRDKGEQAGHERGATDCFQHILVAQRLSEGDEIDRLARAPLLHQNAKDRLMRRNVEVFLFDFFDAFRDDVLRRDQHRTEHALLGFHAMRRRAVNILCRTCGRALKNSPATLLRQASVSAISRCLTRLLRTTSLRARHLFASSE